MRTGFAGLARVGALVLALVGPWSAATASAAAIEPPDDPLFRHQFHLPAIQIPAAWAVSRGTGATVAVLDTGVAYESRGRYRRAPDLAGTRFVPGWDFVDGDPRPHDVPPADGRRSHGTHIAGIIAQTANNSLGGTGVAPAAAIMPVRVLKPDLRGSARTIARGVRFAADHGADVVNLSIAGPAPARVLTDAIAHARAKGVTVVAAAGNDGRAKVGWPAAYPGVIAVGAVAKDLRRARYSNHGRRLDLVAPAGAGNLPDTGYGPGDGVVAQTLKGGPAEFCFCFMASTSAAAAEVSGVAALLVGSRRAKRPRQVRAALLSSARDLPPRGRDPETGWGLVQARDALTGAGARPGDSPSRGERESDAWPRLTIGAAALAVLAGIALVARGRRRASA